MVKEMRLRTLTVNAIECAGQVFLIDRLGRKISRSLDPAQIEGQLQRDTLVRLQWAASVRRMQAKLKTRLSRRQLDVWMQKASSLAASFRLRRRFCRPKPVSRQRFERYLTDTWSDACTRLVMQGINRNRRHSRSGWVRWSHTVANNHNKKRGGRYSYEYYCDREANHGIDRAAELLLCDERTGTDSGNSLA
jgi:hypothetical protein